MAELQIGRPPVDATRPYDHEPISCLPAYIRETRRAMFTTDIHDVVFESNIEVGDAVYLDSTSHTWRRSLASPNPTLWERYRFHGIAHVGVTQRSVRVFGFVSYPFWNFINNQPVYVSSTDVGKLTLTAPTNTRHLIAGIATHIDALLIDSGLSYWESVRNELWASRGEFPYLQNRLDSELSRLVAVEVAIGNGRGGFITLNARFDHITGRVVLLENELQNARGAFANLGLRLSGADSDRLALWNALGVLTTNLNTQIARLDGRIDSEITRVNTNFFTRSEVLGLFGGLSTDVTNALLVFFAGTTSAISVLWQLDATGVVGRSTVGCTNASTFTSGSYFIIQTLWGNFCVWYSVSGTGTAPSVPGATNIRVNVLINDTADVVGTATATAINNFQRLRATNVGLLVTLTIHGDGPVRAINGLGLSGFTYTETVIGIPADINHVMGLPDHFQVDGTTQLFQGSLEAGLTTRPSTVNLATVNDVWYDLDVNGDIMPRTAHLQL